MHYCVASIWEGRPRELQAGDELYISYQVPHPLFLENSCHTCPCGGLSARRLPHTHQAGAQKCYLQQEALLSSGAKEAA